MSEDCINGIEHFVMTRTKSFTFVTALLQILIRLTAEKMEVFKYACVFVPVVDA